MLVVFSERYLCPWASPLLLTWLIESVIITIWVLFNHFERSDPGFRPSLKCHVWFGVCDLLQCSIQTQFCTRLSVSYLISTKLKVIKNAWFLPFFASISFLSSARWCSSLLRCFLDRDLLWLGQWDIGCFLLVVPQGYGFTKPNQSAWLW